MSRTDDSVKGDKIKALGLAKECYAMKESIDPSGASDYFVVLHIIKKLLCVSYVLRVPKATIYIILLTSQRIAM